MHSVNVFLRVRRYRVIHGYHLIFGTYGFWLPNDPRGAWSDYVYAWELAKFGKATKSLERVDVAPAEYAVWRAEAQRALAYPPVSLDGKQAKAVGEAFSTFCAKNRLGIWACSILPEHVHLVLGRHRYKMEIVANLLKGAATKRLVENGLHPMAAYRETEGRLPKMWAKNQWISYLDSEHSIEQAIAYVERNPTREGMRLQKWTCVMPFTGISTGGWLTY